MERNGVNIDTFLLECEDLLRLVEATLLEHRDRTPDDEVVNGLFRSFHSIKGAAGMVGFDDVAAFTHTVENVLDRLRRHELQFGSELADAILRAKDRIAALIEATVASVAAAADPSLVAVLESFSAADVVSTSTATPTFSTYTIRFAPQRAFRASDFDLPALLAELRRLGNTTVQLDTQALPALAALDLQRCYLAWDIRLLADCGESAVRDAFLFAPGDALLEITALPEAGVVLFADDETASPQPSAATPVVSLAAKSPTRAAKSDNVVRVSSDKLDQLVALVGELVINQSRLTRVSGRIADPELAEPVEEIERLVVELRESVLGVRMMPIGTTFGRFKRLVHDLSTQLGKQVELITEGAQTELDKNVLDRLVEPLVHLVRNSLDHGIEPAAERLAANKPASGSVRISATHAGQHVVIKISDDGRGLDAEAIREKAVERGLIGADQVLPPSELLKLIFLPGFSTAKQVTDVSGRGVGMDVVKRQIEALRGSVAISSEPTRGTTIALTLPLTLAIIDGLLVELAGERYILAHGSVHETVELPAGDRLRHNQRQAVSVRGQLVQYIRLRDAFALQGREPSDEKIVIVQHGEGRIGLVVDRVLGGHQTVIQSLGRVYRDIDVVSGATITGDGRVALILNIDGIVRFSGQQTSGSKKRAQVVHEKLERVWGG